MQLKEPSNTKLKDQVNEYMKNTKLHDTRYFKFKRNKSLYAIHQARYILSRHLYTITVIYCQDSFKMSKPLKTIKSVSLCQYSYRLSGHMKTVKTVVLWCFFNLRGRALPGKWLNPSITNPPPSNSINKQNSLCCISPHKMTIPLKPPVK